MTLAFQLLAASRRDDLLREQRRLRLAATLARCRRAISLRFRSAVQTCPA